MKKLLTAIVSLFTILTMLTACGEKEVKVEENKPIAEVTSEAQKMDAAQLQREADAYKAAITAKAGELTKLQDEIKAIPFTEMFGEKARNLKDQAAEIQTSITNLTDRMNVYLNAMKQEQK